MKNISIYTLLLAISLVAIQACGPSEEEQRAAEQARLDSLRQAQQDSIAAVQQAREDSLARVAEQQQAEEEEASNINFSEDGEYVIQVGAWRSEQKANSFLEMWSDREYPNVYISESGNEERGDVWYRVRVGFFDSEQEAEKLGSQLAEEVNSTYWVSRVQRASS